MSLDHLNESGLQSSVAVRVKICGLTSASDAEWALECGADALGFVFQPESKRFVGAFDAERVPDSLGPYALCVAVFGVVPAQLALPTSYAAVQGERCGQASGFRRIEAVRIGGARMTDLGAIDADAVLLDAYDERAYGGTGKTIDWGIAAEIVAQSELPVILAGGLDPDNVANAIRTVRPYAVDVCSGVEASAGVKDRAKVRDFIQAAKSL